MEIEAKFGIPDESTFERLLKAPFLAGLSLGPAALSGLQDTYLDTAGRSILAGGYACRLRRDGERTLLTVKGLGGAAGGVHRREEHELELPGMLPPNDWPPGPARDRVMQLAAGRPLMPLFTLDHTRFKRPMSASGRPVAELSLDRVRMVGDDSPDPLAAYLEVEAELLPEGTEEDLAALTGELQRGWGLLPENRSKFERGLALLDGRKSGPADRSDESIPAPARFRPTASPAGQRLSPPERAILERLAAGPAVDARRARLLLAWDEGVARPEALARSGLSARRARHWLQVFQSRRLAIFPRRVLKEAMDALRSDAPPALGPDVSSPVPIAPEQPAAAGPQAPQPEPPAEQPDVPGSSQAPQPEPPAVEQPRSIARSLKAPGLQTDDSMSEAGRKTLRFHYYRLLEHEPGTREGKDPEHLHDMRVATRRMRAAFRLFGPYYDPEIAVPLEKGLRLAGRTLGAVRDLDVFGEKVQAYLDSLPAAQRSDLDPLRAALEARRSAAHEQLIDYLDGKKYARLRERLDAFVETEGLGSLPVTFEGREAQPHRVCHVAPMAIYERLAVVRAFDEWVSQPNPPVTRLHALRIASKRLRYTLEFFREVLGPEAKVAIAEVVELQDHLGALQDAVVASGILRDFLVWGTWGDDLDRRSLPDLDAPVIAPGVAAYLAVRQSELQQLLVTFPALWENFKSPEFSRRIAAAVSVL